MSRLDPDRLIFNDTASKWGRFVAVSPKNSVLGHLNYARIRLGGEQSRTEFSTERRETGLICLHGQCTLVVNGERIAINQHDGIYIPRDSKVEVSTDSAVDLIECSAEVEGKYPLQIVRYADVMKDPSLRFKAGSETTSRDLNIVLGKNIQAGRIVAGFTRSAPGNWTSWPPHEHTELLEELYVYFDMPPPGFGIQLVYTEPNKPEFVRIVRDGDAVLMPAGYHPNVAAPGHSINFVWMMAAHTEVEGRQFGVVNVQPGFDQAGSGLEASRKPGSATART
jgi:5-deoxy-glucuronate isomerase